MFSHHRAFPLRLHPPRRPARRVGARGAARAMLSRTLLRLLLLLACAVPTAEVCARWPAYRARTHLTRSSARLP